MAFYDLLKTEGINVVVIISANILNELNADKSKKNTGWFSQDDTSIRKSAYLAVVRNKIRYVDLFTIRLKSDFLQSNFFLRFFTGIF